MNSFSVTAGLLNEFSWNMSSSASTHNGLVAPVCMKCTDIEKCGIGKDFKGKERRIKINPERESTKFHVYMWAQIQDRLTDLKRDNGENKTRIQVRFL